MTAASALAGLTYHVRTFGCQMNLHDSERVSGVLGACGCVEVATPEEADIVVYMTCCVREKADTHLYGQVSAMVSAPKPPSGTRTVAIGGCIAQRDGDTIRSHMPNVDVVFGTRAVGSLPDLVVRSRQQGALETDTSEDDPRFSTDLPSRRETSWHAWVPIMTGCNNFCSYCIVPYVRGRERDRRFEDIVAEVVRLRADGVREVCLLGQNVNSFGYGMGDRYAFSKLLRACGTIEGLERVRFTSPHPAAFTDDVIAAMAETPNVMHQLHFPLQSGSDRILRAMRRSYRSAKFLDILGRIRAAMPDAQISTDVIVGFPGETEEDFQATLDVMREARFSTAFMFIYSPRPGTPAAAMEQLPHDVVQERFERLVALQERITEENLATFEGRDVEVMVTGHNGKKDSDTHRVTGREKTGVLVHIGVPEGEPEPAIGDFVTATVTHAGRHNLIADPDPRKGQTYHVRH